MKARMTSAARILVADDHQIVRTGICAVINPEPDLTVVGEAANGSDAIERFQELRPDITILDLRMPGVDGLQALRRIRQIDPQARVLILSTYDGLEEIHQAMDAGASGYVLKRSSDREIVPAIRALLSGKPWIPDEIASRLAAHEELEKLSNREIEVLNSLASGDANKEIASALHISEHTVKDHIKSIFHKLKARDRTEAVVIGLRRGLIRLNEGS